MSSVYVIKFPLHNLVKIGQSSVPDIRINTLSKAMQSEAEVVQVVNYRAPRHAATLEKYLHIRYAKFAALAPLGISTKSHEWFAPSILDSLVIPSFEDAERWLTENYRPMRKRYKKVFSYKQMKWVTVVRSYGC